MNFLEKDLEDIIFNTPHSDLEERGLYLPGKKMRQVNITGYGVADLIVADRDWFSKCIEITVLELKKGAIDGDALTQLIRYLRGVQRYLEYRGVENFILRGALIGSELRLGDMVYLPDLIYSGSEGYLNSLSYYTYEYKFDGIYFSESSGWHRRKEGWCNE